ncbi:MAG: type II secretion system F family protein [Candidatus Aenigmatarchaeota archaeon]
MSIEYSLFSWLVERVKKLKFFLRIKRALTSTRSKTLYSIYLARMFFYTFLSFIIGIFIFFIPINIPKEFFILKSLIPFLIPITVFLTFYFGAIQGESDYRREIENNFISAVSHMMAISESNINPYLIFKIISNFEEYGALSKELKEVVIRVENYGIDFISAIKEVASTTCSPIFQKFLGNLASIIESGGDLKKYLKITYDYLMFDWRIKKESFLQRLGTISEIYIGLVVSLPLFLVSIMIVMAAIQESVGGISLTDLFKIFTYIILPFLNIFFLVFIKGIEVEI